MERQFKGVWIPADIWLNTDLSPLDKMLYADVDSFSSRNATYYKSNQTIATELGVGVATVQRSLSKLIDAKLISRKSYDGRVRHLVVINETHQNDPTPQSIEPVPIDQNDSLGTQVKKPNEKPIEKIVLPWQTDDFEQAWSEWKAYKKSEHRFQYRQPATEQRALITLQNTCNGDQTTAIDAIQTSIANGWKGLFPRQSSSRSKLDPATTLAWASQ